MTVAVEARELSKIYEDEGEAVVALNSVDLVLEAGEFVAVMGPSGSGKSTLLHLLGGLDRPDVGEVLVDNRSLNRLSAEQLAALRNRRIGFVFQFFNLIPNLTLEENILLPATIAGVPERQIRPTLSQLLEETGLEGKRRRFPAQLSGGEQQRAAVARALIMSPAIVLADEPTGNLDTRAGQEVLALLSRYHAAGQTMILVTHDARIAAGAQRVISLRDGRIVDDTRLRATSNRGVGQRVVSLEDRP